MRLYPYLLGEDGAPEVVTDSVPAGNLQPWMLTLDPESGEVFVVLDDPELFHPGDAGRPHRWVRVPITVPEGSEVDTGVIEAAATTRVDIVYGAELDELQPMLPDDIYTTDEEALARNGMCHERIDVAEDDPEPDRPIYCGRPSDPDSFYRDCRDHDQARREESDDLVARGFEATYGVIAEATH